MLRQEMAKGLNIIGGTLLLLFHALKHMGSLPRQWALCLEHAYMIGYRTFPIVAVMSLFIGGVLALQTGYSLSTLTGAKNFLGNVVGLSMARELGPVMTAFLLAGRMGSSIAAELGAMTVYQEVDALKMMNVPPERFLVLPRIVAILLMMPALTLFSVVLGWMGGQLVSEYVQFIQLDSSIYWRGLKASVEFKSVMDGLVKAELFGLVVVLVGCYEGLSARGGPREIGRAVTHAVVGAMVLILVLDYFVTRAQM